jgi:DnaK suppressor protein
LDYQQLGLVEEALDRIKSGDYGSCQACGQPIPCKRLKVVPWARCCVECQQRVMMEDEF